MEPNGTVVIVTYNSRDCIDACLDPLREAARDGWLKVVVVDNDSDDGTADHVESGFDWVELIRSGENGGFGAGNNRGFAQAAGEWVFVLNPDATVSSGCMETLDGYLAGYPDVGIAAPGVTDTAGRIVRSFHPFQSLPFALLNATGLHRFLNLNRIDGRWRLFPRPPDNPALVERVLGAAMMIRRRALDEVGWFDERFFLFSEEEDLCRRFRNAGWKVVFHPRARVSHAGGASVSYETPLAVAAVNWSRFLFMRKHYSALSAHLARLAWVAALALRLLVSAFSVGDDRLRQRRRGYILALKSLLVPGYFETRLRPVRVSAVKGAEEHGLV